MPWSVPKEYAQYLTFIKDQTVIMGRTSYEIFGEDLTSAHTIVLSRQLAAGPGYTVYADLEEALAYAQTLGKRVFVAGGAQVYQQALALADEMYLSIIHGEFEGDRFFPAFQQDQWAIEEQREEKHFTFYRYQRI